MDKQCEMDKCFEFLKTQSERTDRVNRWLMITLILSVLIFSISTLTCVITCNKTMQTMTTEYFNYDNPPIEAVQSDINTNQSIKIGGESK